MRNSSHSPGCMRALPASQSCQVRSVEEMSAAAADWESPASSLACRISQGDGLAGDGMAGEVLCGAVLLDDGLGGIDGGISRCFSVIQLVGDFGANYVVCGDDEIIRCSTFGAGVDNCADDCVEENAIASGEKVGAIGGRAKHRASRRKGFGEGEGCLNRVVEGGHDLLQLFGLRRATHELNYTRIPCNSKSFLQKLNEAPTPPHNLNSTTPNVAKPATDVA